MCESLPAESRGVPSCWVPVNHVAPAWIVEGYVAVTPPVGSNSEGESASGTPTSMLVPSCLPRVTFPIGSTIPPGLHLERRDTHP
jgi:hypothetical protein